MSDFICPDCQRPIMSMKKIENLLKTSESKVLLGHCFCGVGYEIRTLKRKILDISTTSGKRTEQLIGEDEDQ